MAPDVDVCGKCKDNFIVSTRYTKCSKCFMKFHTSCTSFKDNWLKVLSDCDNLVWICNDCKNNFCNIESDYQGKINLLEKEIECIHREKALLERLLSEIKYSHDLQKTIIKTQDEQLVSLRANQTSTSYSQVVANSEAVKVNIDNSAVLLIKSRDNKRSNEDIMKDITSNINPADLNVCINRTHKLKNGIAVHCEDNNSLNILKSNLCASLSSKYSINETKKLNPRLLISNVHLDGLDTTQDIINNITSLNGLDENCRSDIKFVTKLKHHNNIDLVIEVTPELRKLFLQKGYLFIGWKKSYVKDHLRIVKCFKCCGYGHVEKDCTSELLCPKCSASHNRKDCKTSIFKCPNCINHNKNFRKNLSVDHEATSVNCPIYKSYVERLKQKINYG